MSDFVSKELKTIDLGNKKWIKIPKEISFGQVQAFISGGEDKTASALAAMVDIIKEWNLETDDGVAGITVDNLKDLPINTYRIIDSAISDLIKDDKKKV